MTMLLALPNDILILICQHLTIPALLNFRLVHSHFATLVLANSTSIAASVARTTFPEAKLLLRPPRDGRQDFVWLKGLVLKFVAAILVDRLKSASECRFPQLPSMGIPAESEIGDQIRLRVEHGLRIFDNLSTISKNVYAQPDVTIEPSSPKHNMRRPLSWWKHKKSNKSTPPLYPKEAEILQQRLQYLENLGLEELKDFQLTKDLVTTMILTVHDRELRPTSRYWEYDGSDDFDWNVAAQIRVANGNSWVNWALLHLGPYIYFQQWCLTSCVSRSLVKDTLLTMWKERTPEEIETQRNNATSINKIVMSKTGHQRIIYNSDVMDHWENYRAWEHGLERFHSGEPLPHCWTKSIPFFVNFRTTDSQ